METHKQRLSIRKRITKGLYFSTIWALVVPLVLIGIYFVLFTSLAIFFDADGTYLQYPDLYDFYKTLIIDGILGPFLWMIMLAVGGGVVGIVFGFFWGVFFASHEQPEYDGVGIDDVTDLFDLV